MARQQFYEPLIQEEQEAVQMRGFGVAIGGTYVLLDDVVTVLRQFAQSLPDADQAALVHEIATWLISGEQPSRPVTETIAEPVAYEVHGAEPDDVTLDVARIEVFPDPPDDPKPKWYARSIDTGGHILKTTGGSFDFEWVVKNAQERWPEIEVHLLKNAGDDSMWSENQTSANFKNENRGVFPSMGPPIRRLWGNNR